MLARVRVCARRKTFAFGVTRFANGFCTRLRKPFKRRVCGRYSARRSRAVHSRSAPVRHESGSCARTSRRSRPRLSCPAGVRPPCVSAIARPGRRHRRERARKPERETVRIGAETVPDRAACTRPFRDVYETVSRRAGRTAATPSWYRAHPCP